MVDQTEQDEVIVGEYTETPQEEVDTTEVEAALQAQVEDATPPPPQQELFKPGSGVARVEKKMAKGKKVTAQESFRAMMEMKQTMGMIISDLQKLANAVQSHEMGLSHVFANINCLINLCTKTEVAKIDNQDDGDVTLMAPLFTEEAYKENWDEVVVKPQQEAQEKMQKEMMEKTKAEAAEAVAKAAHPECHYCGKDDCEYCNGCVKTESKPEAKTEECCVTDDDECVDCNCTSAAPLGDPEE